MNWDDIKIPNIIGDIESGKIKVVSDEEAANCEWRLCAFPPAPLKRSVIDKCSQCDKDVVYDPKMPRSEKQKLICLPCALMIVNQDSFSA